jgi:glycosyltransferase involved in cell wall biosynthesis
MSTSGQRPVTRLFYLSWIAPVEGSGATLAMRRHLIEHRDFDVFVATTEDFQEPGIPSIRVKQAAWLLRLSRTRFVRYMRNLELLIFGSRLCRQVVRAAKEFRPDAIVTVADLTLSEQARKLAKLMRLPLVVNFQDWWPRGQFYYDFEKPFLLVRPIFERRFRRLYREAALAFCTSEGMRDHLGPHPNAHVLYPIGAQGAGDADATARGGADEGITRSALSRKKRLIYTGTAFGSYGKMLRELAREMGSQDEWELVIFGNTPDWPKEELERARQTGLYRGLLRFDELRRELNQADACLAVMTFAPEFEIMMRTSFTTKLLDYCQVGKPVILWAPPYCSPVRLAKQRNAAAVIEQPDALAVVSAMRRISSEPEYREALSKAAVDLAATDLAHENIHNVFRSRIREIDGRGNSSQ